MSARDAARRQAADPRRTAGQLKRWAAHREAVANGLVVPKRVRKPEALVRFRETMAAKFAEGYQFPRRSDATKELQRRASTGVVFSQERCDKIGVASRRTLAQEPPEKRDARIALARQTRAASAKSQCGLRGAEAARA